MAKQKQDSAIFSALCIDFNTLFLYVNQVGGQDSLLFDGHSCALDKSGKVIANAHRFQEDLIVVDVDRLEGERRFCDDERGD